MGSHIYAFLEKNSSGGVEVEMKELSRPSGPHAQKSSQFDACKVSKTQKIHKMYVFYAAVLKINERGLCYKSHISM
jgi:hypothetical protein